ncbi:uncharacterized protein LOC127728845 [Mytilus californianus]|uniref:uncharacterized protein LOC127728845 n=1 Tax=Mytilus californianus TaxID=6549 RepID=UPI0022459D81|nr:uncharacterized protein LOC127728845 [Mytilus californianus]
MNEIIVVLLFCILDGTFGCTNCPEHQSQNVKNDLCRKNTDGQYNTNVFQCTILEVKEMIPDTNSIMETSDQLDVIQLYYVVEITKVYKTIGALQENHQIQLKTSNDCVPDKLEVDRSYLLAANTDLIIGRCNIAKLSENTSKDDEEWLEGNKTCS